jgi:hypothetical protein
MLPGFPVEIEIPFRAIAECDLRAADVAAVAPERWDCLSADDDLFGAPELAIEIKSPSNTKHELQDLISPGQRLSRVLDCRPRLEIRSFVSPRRIAANLTGKLARFGEIPLATFGGGVLRAAEICGIGATDDRLLRSALRRVKREHWRAILYS